MQAGRPLQREAFSREVAWVWIPDSSQLEQTERTGLYQSHPNWWILAGFKEPISAHLQGTTIAEKYARLNDSLTILTSSPTCGSVVISAYSVNLISTKNNLYSLICAEHFEMWTLSPRHCTFSSDLQTERRKSHLFHSQGAILIAGRTLRRPH